VPKVVAAAQAQMAKLVHGQVNIAFHQPMIELCERLKNKVWFKFGYCLNDDAGYLIFHAVLGITLLRSWAHAYSEEFENGKNAWI